MRTRLTESSNSLVASQNLIKKVYFPRLIIPMGSVIAGLVDFCFAFIVLIGMMFYYGIQAEWFDLSVSRFPACWR